jgi:signal transduction histidine kinase
MRFRDLPIKRKVMGVILLTSFCVLALTSAALLSYEVYSYKQTTTRSLSTLGDVIAANSAAALIYDDQKVAQELLSALSAEPEIVAAALYDKSGQVYATYPQGRELRSFPTRPGADGLAFKPRSLALFQPVMQGQGRVGTLYMEQDLEEMYRRLRAYSLVLLGVLLGSGAVALLLSNFFQHRISEPLLALAETAKTVSEQKDYSVRASKPGQDEIGFLTDAFNSMLAQIQQSHAEVERARDAAEKASRAKDDFLAALSHELRTPLNPVLLLASDAAVNATLPADVRSDFETIRKNVELEARLIDDLLDLTRITRGKLVLDLHRVNVLVVLRDAIATVAAELEQKRIALVTTFSADAHEVMGDPVRLQQIFWNVLRNAVKFTPPNGRIVVEARVTGSPERVVVKITDTGIGMTADEIERVFDAFAQGDHANVTGSHRFGGIGMGLAISRMLVESQKGTIRAASQGRNQGSEFTIELPKALEHEGRTDASSPEAAPAVAACSNGAGSSGPRKRILLVEDHDPTRIALTHLLALRDYDVTPAGTVTEARAVGMNQVFDLLISDIGLPDGSGYDLIAELHERRGLRGVALTGYGMEQDIARSREAGFIAHLTKPVSMPSLDKVLAQALKG